MSSPERPSLADAEERADVRVLTAFITVVVLCGVGLLLAASHDLYPGEPPATGATVIRGGTVFDGSGGPVQEAALVVVEDTRIACVGPACRVPEGARVIDAAGLAVLPGLIDLAVHFSEAADTDLRPFPLLMWEWARSRPRARRALHAAGVTTIRELGNVKGITLTLKRLLASGTLAGPRVYAVGPVFTAPGGIPAGTDLRGGLWVIENATRQVSTPEAARTEVDRLAREGVDGVAAVCDTGILDRLPRLDAAVLEAIVAEAHAHGLWAAVTTGRIRDVEDAALAGADTIQYGAIHQGPLEPRTAKLLQEHGVTFVPALAAIESFLRQLERPERPPQFPAELWERLQERRREGGMEALLAPIFASLRTLTAAGVRIGAGASGGRALGTGLPRELELLVAAGLSPAEALLAATRDAAAALRAADLGTLAPGKLADVLLVEGRPWERIGDVRQVRVVMQGGRVLVDTRREGERT